MTPHHKSILDGQRKYILQLKKKKGFCVYFCLYANISYKMVHKVAYYQSLHKKKKSLSSQVQDMHFILYWLTDKSCPRGPTQFYNLQCSNYSHLYI